ncbi:restriction endonuclease subunit S [Arenibacter algicola]|jgi:type I restriction enzyme S subunit|uniref:EcoKI restriction-modification system protein HsdS n=1 Tax=Arenibacter algicola TaxID=616991 RepID=A0A221V2B8_9FLAO|nr:restriction endonuclease subunit S [Arenibacter algicola]ASO07518.1 EcoKI restriction-modification system protein HsdS [Arenibacter algicola]
MAKEYLIGDFLKRIKRPIQLIDDQEYKLVTIKMNHNGVVLREHKKGALIKSKMYEVKKGDFILSGIDARNGAFGIVPPELDGAIVTNDFWYFKIDENIISKRLFLELTATTWFDEICTRGSDGTTQRIRLQKNKFFNQSVMLPEGNEQKVLLDKILSFKIGQSKLDSEIQTQKLLTTQLKQSILQEAIQGKLTADWRAKRALSGAEVEPVSELLKRIKAEKAQLIKDKKIKKEKPLPPITAADIPFEIPDGWVWCRLGEIIVNADNLDIQKKLSPDDIINYVDIDAVDNKKQVVREAKKLPVRELSSRARRVLKKGHILYSLVRPYLHNLAIVNEDKPNLIGSTGFAVFDCIRVENKYIFWLLLSKYIEDVYLDFMDGFNSPSITHDQFKSTIIPVPPLKEQKVIVEKVELLMQKYQALEQEIKTSEANAEMLMQAVLKEAFLPAESSDKAGAGKQEVVVVCK